MDFDLDWRHILIDEFDWPGAGTDQDPCPEMDFGRQSKRTIKALEDLKDYISPEYDPAYIRAYKDARKDAPKDERDDDPDEYQADFSHVEGETLEDALAQIYQLEQNLHKLHASFYRSEERLGPEKEERFCICPGAKVVSWTELSSGYSWIAVSGNDTTCVVTVADPIRKRPANKKQLNPFTVLKGALSDMIGDTPNSFRKILPHGYSGHFAIVSVAPCDPDQELELRSLEKHRCLFRFLQEKLEDRSTLSYKETEQIAVCALKLLLRRAFNPYKTDVCGWGNQFSGIGYTMGADCVREALTSMVQQPKLPPGARHPPMRVQDSRL